MIIDVIMLFIKVVLIGMLFFLLCFLKNLGMLLFLVV